MKTWLKTTLATVGVVGSAMFALTGCGVKSDIKNDSDDILFNGGIVSVVGDHLVFANGYASEDIETIDNYNDFAKFSYLAAVNSENLESGKFVSPEGVQKLKGEVLGYENGYTFVYKNYIYYAIPNKHKTDSLSHVLNYVSYYKCRFDGSNTKELFYTSSFDSEKAQVRAVKFDGKAYLFVYDGTEFRVVNLESDSVKIISSKATSVALPNEGEEWNGKAFYTEDKENANGQTGNAVFSYSVTDGKSQSLKNPVGDTVTFTGRIRNKVFYTLTSSSVTQTMTADSNQYANYTFASVGESYYSSEISNIISITGNELDDYNTVIFTSSLTDNEQIMIDKNGTKQVLLQNGDYSEVLFAHNGLVYYSTSDGISCKDVDTNSIEKIVENMTIISDKVGYEFSESGNVSHIYFYAQLVYPDDDETEEDDRDTNYYLFQVEANGAHDVKLVGKKN